MNNNKKLIMFGIIGLVVLIGAGVLVLSSNKKPPEPVALEPEAPVEEAVNTLSPEGIGLVLTSTLNNKKVIMEIINVADISSLDYELSYKAKGNIPRGAIGHVDVKGKPVKQEIVLGTCSDVCHYDQEVSDIKLILKVVKTDNKVYSVEKSLEL